MKKDCHTEICQKVTLICILRTVFSLSFATKLEKRWLRCKGLGLKREGQEVAEDTSKGLIVCGVYICP